FSSINTKGNGLHFSYRHLQCVEEIWHSFLPPVTMNHWWTCTTGNGELGFSTFSVNFSCLYRGAGGGNGKSSNMTLN
ncbi:unnamed protein product, partial [Allacma fusca]